MIEDVWYDDFLEALSKMYPKRVKLVQDLVELLKIEPESVYRRLRKEVYFTSHEMAKMVSEWNMSFDEIAGITPKKIPFKIQTFNHPEVSQRETEFMQQIKHTLHFLQKSPNAEYLEVCNRLPCPFYANFAYLNQYYMFRWLHQYSHPSNIIPFSQAAFSWENIQLSNKYCHAMKQIPKTDFILDDLLFEHLVNDILYFQSVRMITDEEKELLKNNLYCLLDYLAKIAHTGYYPETKKKVTLYILQINIDTNYCYICDDNTRITFIHLFDKFETQGFNSETFLRYKTWLQLMKRYSSKISEVDEKRRFEFFRDQRQCVDRL